MRVLLVVLLAALTAATSSGATVEERLARLESEVEGLRAENAELRRMIGATPTQAAAPKEAEAPKKTVQFGGLVQAQGDSGAAVDSRYSDDNDRFYLRRARLNAGGNVTPEIGYRAEVELAGIVANVNGLRAQATDAYVIWKPARFAAIRGGQFKAPFGAEQLVSDPLLSTPERTLGSDRLTPGRQLGVQLSGDLAGKRASWAAGIFNGNGINNNFNDNGQFLYAGRLSGTVWSGAGDGQGRLAGGLDAFHSVDTSVALAPDLAVDSAPGTPAFIFAGNRTGLGIDAHFSAGPWDFTTEILRERFEPDSALGIDEFTAEAWFVQVTRLALEGRLQGVLRYDRFDRATDREGFATSSFDAGVNYFFKGDDVKLMLHYVSGETGDGDRKGRVIARIQTVF